jgi:ribosomal protein L11 methyltransferase
MKKSWHQLVIATNKAEAEELEDELLRAGAISITIQDAGDQPIFEPGPGETPIWAELQITGLFEADTRMEQVVEHLQSSLGKISIIESGSLEDRPWEREWISHFKPIRFGQRLWICPSWCDPPEPEAINLMLDPGLAFGTGTHETTALCLEWLEAQDLKDKKIIDYGCGSGVLGIAALLLGCKSVQAIDNDPQALLATAQNGLSNGLADTQLTVSLPDGNLCFSADIVMANILAGPLIELASKLASLLCPGGLIVLSGILKEQTSEVSNAYLPYFDLHKVAIQGDWIRLSGIRQK